VGRRIIACTCTKFASLTAVIFKIVPFWVISEYSFPGYETAGSSDSHLHYHIVSLPTRTPSELSALWPIQQLQRGKRNPDVSSSKCVVASIEQMCKYVATCKLDSAATLQVSP
jgi:hypothetical protein